MIYSSFNDFKKSRCVQSCPGYLVNTEGNCSILAPENLPVEWETGIHIHFYSNEVSASFKTWTKGFRSKRNNFSVLSGGMKRLLFREDCFEN